MRKFMHLLLGFTLAGTLLGIPFHPHSANAHSLRTVSIAQSLPVQELASARNATAKYHDVDQAEAEGYVSIDFCEEHEGCHWLNPSLVDGNFDVEHPEILIYAPGEDGVLHLVAVEYIVPLAASPGAPPEGFTGDADAWREDTERAGLWEV